MRYSLKSLVQFRGMSYVLKIPFQDVGLGKAMRPWVSEEILNKIADELIIKSQNMVVLAKSFGEDYDCFLMDVNVGDFNENYRQNCIDLLNILVTKHLNANSYSYNSDDRFEDLAVSTEYLEDDFIFFNPNSPLNLFMSKFNGRSCEDWARANYFSSGLTDLLFDGEVVNTAYVASINDICVYSFDKSWADKYNAKKIAVKDLLNGISLDLMGENHNLGDYVIGWKFNKELDLVKVSEALTALMLKVSFPSTQRKKILSRVVGIEYKSELEALGCNSLFESVMKQSYSALPLHRNLLREKDNLMSEAFEMYWEGIKKNNYEGIDFLSLKEFFRNNKRYSSDNGAFLKIYLFQVLSALTLGMKPKNLEIFDLSIKEIAPFFDRMFQKNLCLEFAKVIERDEISKSLYFGIKVVDNFKEEDLNYISSKIESLPGLKEFYASKPLNAQNALLEILFFNSDWNSDLKRDVHKYFKKKPKDLTAIEINI